MKKLIVLFALAAFLGVSSATVFALTETNKIVRVNNDDDPKKKDNKETEENKESKENKEAKENKDAKSECPGIKSPSCCEKSKECEDKK